LLWIDANNIWASSSGTNFAHEFSRPRGPLTQITSNVDHEDLHNRLVNPRNDDCLTWKGTSDEHQISLATLGASTLARTETSPRSNLCIASPEMQYSAADGSAQEQVASHSSPLHATFRTRSRALHFTSYWQVGLDIYEFMDNPDILDDGSRKTDEIFERKVVHWSLQQSSKKCSMFRVSDKPTRRDVAMMIVTAVLESETNPSHTLLSKRRLLRFEIHGDSPSDRVWVPIFMDAPTDSHAV